MPKRPLEPEVAKEDVSSAIKKKKVPASARTASAAWTSANRAASAAVGAAAAAAAASAVGGPMWSGLWAPLRFVGGPVILLMLIMQHAEKIDYLEYFAGERALTKAHLASGNVAVAYEKMMTRCIATF